MTSVNYFLYTLEKRLLLYMNSLKTYNSVKFYFMKNSFSNISRKCILPNMIRAGTGLNHFWHNALPSNIRNKFTLEIKRDGITSFMDFMI